MMILKNAILIFKKGNDYIKKCHLDIKKTSSITYHCCVFIFCIKCIFVLTQPYIQNTMLVQCLLFLWHLWCDFAVSIINLPCQIIKCKFGCILFLIKHKIIGKSKIYIFCHVTNIWIKSTEMPTTVLVLRLSILQDRTLNFSELYSSESTCEMYAVKTYNG